MGPLGEAFLDSPEALAIEAGLVGCPGGVPARVLLRVGAAYLVGGDGAGLEAQGLVVGTLCRTREKPCCLKATRDFVSWLCLHTSCQHPLWIRCSLSSLARMLGMLLNPEHNPCSICCPEALGSSFLSLLLYEFLTLLPPSNLPKPVLPAAF